MRRRRIAGGGRRKALPSVSAEKNEDRDRDPSFDGPASLSPGAASQSPGPTANCDTASRSLRTSGAERWLSSLRRGLVPAWCARGSRGAADEPRGGREARASNSISILLRLLGRGRLELFATAVLLLPGASPGGANDSPSLFRSRAGGGRVIGRRVLPNKHRGAMTQPRRAVAVLDQPTNIRLFRSFSKSGSARRTAALNVACPSSRAKFANELRTAVLIEWKTGNEYNWD